MNNRVIKILTGLSLSFFFLLTISCATSRPIRTNLGEPKSEMFFSSKRILDKAVSENTDELAPQYYKEAVNYYFDAENDFEKGKSNERIMKNLEKSEESAQKAIEITQAMKVNFPELIESRNKAIQAGADERELKNYREAEMLLENVSSHIEREGMKKAREDVEKAVRNYQSAELEAIKLNIVGNLNGLLQQFF